MSKRTLKQKTAIAFVWSALRSGIEQGVSFLIFLLIGRLLTPADFGVVALAAGVVEVLRLMSSVGIVEAIIRAPHLDEAAADTAFWTSVTVGLTLAGSLVLLAEPVASLFDQPMLKHIIPVMSLIVVASSLGTTHTGRLARNFGHKALAMRALAANLAGGAAALAVIFAGGGLWALVAQRLAAEIIQTVAVWIALPWIPRLRFSLAELKVMAGFNIRVAISNILDGISMRVQESLVGLHLPVGAVGALRIATRLTDMTQQLVFIPANQATMVAFSRLQGDTTALQKFYLEAVRLSGLAAFPCFLALAVLAPDLVPWLFGRQWAPSIPVLQALCLGVVPTTLLFFMAPMLVAVGKSGALACLSATNLALGVLSTLVACRLGIVAVGIGLTVRAWLLMPGVLYILQRSCSVPPKAVLRALVPPFAAALAAAAPTAALGIWMRGRLPLPVLLAGEVTLYSLAYGALLFRMAEGFLAEVGHSLLPVLPVRVHGSVRRMFRIPSEPRSTGEAEEELVE